MTASDTPPPLTDGFLDEIRALSELAITQRDDEHAPYLDTADSLVLDVPRLLAEVDRLRAELAGLPDLDTIRRIEKERGSWGLQLSDARRELAETRRKRDDLAVRLSARVVIGETISELMDDRDALAAKLAAVQKVIEPSDWKPLSERHPEYFTPDTPEEAARKKGWKQGVDLLTQQLRAALGETGGTEDRPEHECQLDWFAEGDFCGGCDRDQAEAPGEQR